MKRAPRARPRSNTPPLAHLPSAPGRTRARTASSRLAGKVPTRCSRPASPTRSSTTTPPAKLVDCGHRHRSTQLRVHRGRRVRRNLGLPRPGQRPGPRPDDGILAPVGPRRRRRDAADLTERTGLACPRLRRQRRLVQGQRHRVLHRQRRPRALRREPRKRRRTSLADCPPDFETSGSHTASGTVADKAGNVSGAGTLAVHVDATPPSLQIECPATAQVAQAEVTALVTASDAESGLASDPSGTVADRHHTPRPRHRDAHGGGQRGARNEPLVHHAGDRVPARIRALHGGARGRSRQAN